MTKRICFTILAIFIWTINIPNLALSNDVKYNLQILAKVQPISDTTKLDIDFDALDLQGNPFKGLALKGKIESRGNPFWPNSSILAGFGIEITLHCGNLVPILSLIPGERPTIKFDAL